MDSENQSDQFPSKNIMPVGRPWWLIGTIISLILHYTLSFYIAIWYESILKTNPDGMAELDAILPFLQGNFIIGIICISFYITSFIQSRRGFRQFTKKRFIIIIITAFIFFIAYNILIQVFPILSQRTIAACSQIINDVRKSGCFYNVCNRDNLLQIERDKCIRNSSFQYNNPGSCDYINSGREYCHCHFSFAKAGNSNVDVNFKNFINAGGDCSLYSNREKDNAACHAIKEMKESYCENISD